LLVAAATAAALMSWRALRVEPQVAAPHAGPVADVDVAAVAERLAAVLRFPTVSHDDPARLDASPFDGLRDHLAQTYPGVHRALRREIVSRHSLLFTWPGQDTALEPVLLLAHLDVVPVEEGTASGWTHPPFEGRVAGGFVWGRGALDDKTSLVAILEAVEYLVGRGFRPRRTVCLAFGHDEEVGGAQGAGRVAALFTSRGVRIESVLDEGGVVGDGLVPGVARPVALVAVAEKGTARVDLEVEGTGGHGSMPPMQTSVGVLAAAIARLESSQMPARLEGASAAFFDAVAGEMPFLPRLLFANRWAFEPLLLRRLARVPTTNAFIRTTTAATMIEGSPKLNVLPARARASLDFRILQGETVADVERHVRETVADDRVAVRVSGRNPSAESSITSRSYAALTASIRDALPGAVVAPWLSVGATDTRHYTAVARDAYRFVPIALRAEDVPRAHGKDERVAVAALGPAVRFYIGYLERASR